MSPTIGCGPPGFVQLVAHPTRWGLLQELARSDRAVHELTTLVDKPQNLVSYHLRRLRDGGLVTARRSCADARDNYYSIDLGRCRDQLHATGDALHPALGPGSALVSGSPESPPATRPRSGSRVVRVLFVCSGNSARSQIAEALLQHLSDGTVEAVSAGTSPRPLHPNAVRTMERRGIDISARRSKHIDDLPLRRFDHVITLCDLVREVCPEFPSRPNMVHWSLPNPADSQRPDDVTYPEFERIAADLETRIGFLLASIRAARAEPPDPAITQEMTHADPAHR